MSRAGGAREKNCHVDQGTPGALFQNTVVAALEKLIYHSPSLIHVEILPLWRVGSTFTARHVPFTPWEDLSQLLRKQPALCIVAVCCCVCAGLCFFFFKCTRTRAHTIAGCRRTKTHFKISTYSKSHAAICSNCTYISGQTGTSYDKGVQREGLKR